MRQLSKITTLILLLIFTIWRYSFLYNEATSLGVKVTIESPSVEMVQLYYDRGFGFNEHDSTVVDTNAKTKGFFQQDSDLIFKVPLDNFSAFLITSFTHKDAELEIVKAEIVDGLGCSIKELRLYSSAREGSHRVFDNSKINARLNGNYIIFDTKLNLLSFSVSPMNVIKRTIIETLIVFTIIFTVFLSFARFRAAFKRSIRYLVEVLYFIFNPKLTFLFICLIYFYFYAWFNDILFPILFEKVWFFLIAFLIVLFARRGSHFRQKSFLFVCVLWYFLFLLVAGVLHYSALLDANLFSSIAVNNSDYSGVLFDQYKALTVITDNRVTSDQAAFILFTPLLIIVSATLLERCNSDCWKLLTWIPVIFLLNMSFVLTQIKDGKFIPSTGFELTGTIYDFRIIFYFVLPLSVIGVILYKEWWKRIFFLAIIFLDLWLVKISLGRAAILGAALFIFSIPFVSFWKNFFTNKKLYYSIILSYCFVVSIVTIGFSTPSFHNHISKVFTEHFVKTANALFDKSSTYLETEPRPEMQRQAVRLIRLSPIAGWGHAGFQINSPRIRFNNGEPPGVGHVMTSIYLQMATNFGLLGMVFILSIHLLPMWMIFSVRKRIVCNEDRWSVSIVFVTIAITFFLFNTNSFISLPVANFVYSVLLGYLITIALKYDYEFQKNISAFFCMIGSISLLIYIFAAYKTSFGSSGYFEIQRRILDKITNNYSVSYKNLLWDSRKLLGEFTNTNLIIHTKGNPLRNSYTTNVFSLKAKSPKTKMYMESDLLCIETDISNQENPGNIYFVLKIELNDKVIGEEYIYRSSGKSFVFYNLKEYEGKEVQLSVYLDMWKALPYHEDARRGINQEYMPFHKDFSDVGIIIKAVSYRKANNSDPVAVSIPFEQQHVL